MKHFKLLLLFIITSCVVLFIGCRKDMKTVDDSSSQTTQRSVSSQKSAIELQAVRDGLLERLSKLNPEQKERAIANTRFILNQHPEYRNVVKNALNAVAECDANTPINQWLDGELSDWSSTNFLLVLYTGMLDYPLYDAYIFENSSSGQYFGINGEYTQRLTKSFKDLKRFWDIDSRDIVMVGMHGSMLTNRDKIIRTDMALYGTNEEEAGQWADLIIDIVSWYPDQYRGGNHPIFTYNAFAIKGFDPGAPYERIPNKIVMGDGIMDGYTAIGYGDVAPQAILAHEFGHHIQYQLNLFSGSGPAATRRTELMADAFSAYFLAHARGQSMQWKRVKQFLQVFFNIGDCSTTSNDHHGTPAQRMAAANWAYSVVEAAQKQGHIISAKTFATMFDAALPQILMN